MTPYDPAPHVKCQSLQVSDFEQGTSQSSKQFVNERTDWPNDGMTCDPFDISWLQLHCSKSRKPSPSIRVSLAKLRPMAWITASDSVNWWKLLGDTTLRKFCKGLEEEGFKFIQGKSCMDILKWVACGMDWWQEWKHDETWWNMWNAVLKSASVCTSPPNCSMRFFSLSMEGLSDVTNRRGSSGVENLQSHLIFLLLPVPHFPFLSLPRGLWSLLWCRSLDLRYAKVHWNVTNDNGHNTVRIHAHDIHNWWGLARW